MVETRGDKEVTGDVNATGDVAGTNILLSNQSSDPGSPVEGQVWYNSTDEQLKYRDSGATVPVKADAFGWVLVEELTPSAASGPLNTAEDYTAYDEIRIEWNLWDSNSNVIVFALRVNGLSTTIYSQRFATSSGFSTQTSQTQIKMGRIDGTPLIPVIGHHTFWNNTKGRIPGMGQLTGEGVASYNEQLVQSEIAIGGSTQIASFSFYAESGSGLFNGSIRLYGRTI